MCCINILGQTIEMYDLSAFHIYPFFCEGNRRMNVCQFICYVICWLLTFVCLHIFVFAVPSIISKRLCFINDLRFYCGAAALRFIFKICLSNYSFRIVAKIIMIKKLGLLLIDSLHQTVNWFEVYLFEWDKVLFWVFKRSFCKLN